MNTTKTPCKGPIREASASIDAAATAVTAFLAALTDRGLVLTVFGVPVTIALGKAPS